MEIKSLFSLHLHRVGVEGSSPIDGGIVAAPSTMLREQQLLQRGGGGGGGEAAPSVHVRVCRRCVSSPPPTSATSPRDNHLKRAAGEQSTRTYSEARARARVCVCVQSPEV